MCVDLYLTARFMQGFAGSASAVTARAIVRDLYVGVAAARFFSFLVTVTGLSPLVAPQPGALVLRHGSWRYEFLAVAVLGSIVAVVAAAVLPRRTLGVCGRFAVRSAELVRPQPDDV